MQIASTRISDVDDADRMFSSYEDNSFRSYIRDRYERTMDYMEKASVGVARQFLDRSRKIFDSYNSDEALRRTRDAIRAVKGVKRSDLLYQVVDLPGLRSCGYRMQRFLMANPKIRERYHRQLVDGYSDSYIDMEPGKVGRDHYDYRRAINGVYREEIDSEGESVFVREEFFEELVDGDRELDFPEQADILDAWDVQDLFASLGYDSTNRLGGDAG